MFYCRIFCRRFGILVVIRCGLEFVEKFEVFGYE